MSVGYEMKEQKRKTKAQSLVRRTDRGTDWGTESGAQEALRTDTLLESERPMWSPSPVGTCPREPDDCSSAPRPTVASKLACVKVHGLLQRVGFFFFEVYFNPTTYVDPTNRHSFGYRKQIMIQQMRERGRATVRYLGAKPTVSFLSLPSLLSFLPLSLSYCKSKVTLKRETSGKIWRKHSQSTGYLGIKMPLCPHHCVHWSKANKKN